MQVIKELRTTILGLVLAGGLILVASLTDIDMLNGIGKNEIDEVVIGIALILIGASIDRFFSVRQKKHQEEIEAQKLLMVKATMRTVQDIMNNFLNNLLLFQLEAAEVMPPETISQLEDLIRETAAKLKALADQNEIIETKLAVGSGVGIRESGRDE